MLRPFSRHEHPFPLPPASHAPSPKVPLARCLHLIAPSPEAPRGQSGDGKGSARVGFGRKRMRGNGALGWSVGEAMAPVPFQHTPKAAGWLFGEA